jgi:hypothetical protein
MLQWFRRFLNRALPLLTAFVGVLTAIVGLLTVAPELSEKFYFAMDWILASPVVGTALLIVLLNLILTGVFAIIFIRGRITAAASSLGFSASPGPESDSAAEKSEQYVPDDPLSPLLVARSRLIDHIKTLPRYGEFN